MSAEEKVANTFEASPFSKRFLVQLTGSSLLLLALLLGVFSFMAFITFEKVLAPELSHKARLVSEKVARDVGAAVGYGIPVKRLQGMDSYFGALLARNEDIAAIEIAESSRDDAPVLHASSIDRAKGGARAKVSGSGEKTPILKNGAPVAEVRVHVRPGYVARQLEELGYDIATALLIALLVTFEMLSFFVHGRVFGPLHVVDRVLLNGTHGDFLHTIHTKAIAELERVEQRINASLYTLGEKVWDVLEEARELRAAQINERAAKAIDDLIGAFTKKVRTGEPYAFADMPVINIPALRISLFVFMFSEELSRPFLPLLATQYDTAEWLKAAPDFAAGLPIAVFMGVLAMVSLVSGNWVEKLGTRRMFLLGTVPAVIGYFGVFWAWDYTAFIFSRGLSAVGYAMVFVACQGYVMAHSEPASRATNMGAFVGAILVAGICGPAIGGILADRIGYAPTFLVSAALATMSAMVLAVSLDDLSLADKPTAGKPAVRRLAFRMLLNREYAAVAILLAIPAKMMLTGVIFLLTPLYLIGLDAGESSIGRVIMLYGIAVVVFMPRAAAYADKTQKHATMVLLGGLLSGLGGLLLMGWSGFWAMTAVVAFVGLGQALSISQQLALVQRIIESDRSGISTNAAMGLFRSIERSGNMAGPLIAGGMAAWIGIESAVGVLAMLCLGGVALFWLQDRILGRPAETG